MKYKMQILMMLMILQITLLRATYPDYNFTIHGTPYPSKLFIHSMSSTNPHMGILNPDLSLHWNVSSGDQGFDFRENNGKLSYYDKMLNLGLSQIAICQKLTLYSVLMGLQIITI